MVFGPGGGIELGKARQRSALVEVPELHGAVSLGGGGGGQARWIHRVFQVKDRGLHRAQAGAPGEALDRHGGAVYGHGEQVLGDAQVSVDDEVCAGKHREPRSLLWCSGLD